MTKKSEYMIQVEFMNWCRKRALVDERWSVAHHIPNGGSRRSAREGMKFKLMGVVAGIPDVFIPIPNNSFNGLYIEFKNDSGSVSKVQKNVHSVIRGNGYAVAVCRSAEEAIRVAEDYIANTEDFED